MSLQTGREAGINSEWGRQTQDAVRSRARCGGFCRDLFDVQAIICAHRSAHVVTDKG